MLLIYHCGDDDLVFGYDGLTVVALDLDSSKESR